MKDDESKKTKKSTKDAAKKAKKSTKDAAKQAKKSTKDAAKKAAKAPAKGKTAAGSPVKPARTPLANKGLSTTPVAMGDSELRPGVKTFLEALRAQLLGERATGELFIKDAAKVRKALGELGNAQWADNAKVLLDRALEDHNAVVSGQAKVVYLF